MIGDPFRSRNTSRPERPSFRPFLETLESREVPSCAETSAAFNALPTNMSNLLASASAGNANAVDTNINAVVNDMFQLRVGAPGFVAGDRLQIDNALITNGLSLIYNGFLDFPKIPIPQFENMVQLGATALRAGIYDFLLTGFFPGTSGNCTLT